MELRSKTIEIFVLIVNTTLSTMKTDAANVSREPSGMGRIGGADTMREIVRLVSL